MLDGFGLNLHTLADYKEIPDIIEDGRSFFENALKKAKTVAGLTGHTALADDSGLEVDALEGAPGIYSARYAGEVATDALNNAKLLAELKGVPPEKRVAAFRCVLVLYHPDGRYESFEGRWQGYIAETPAGTGGFGYDPIFYLPDMGVTVSQLPEEIKNSLSHRAQAIEKLKKYLRENMPAG